jgi:hypothetical protein
MPANNTAKRLELFHYELLQKKPVIKIAVVNVANNDDGHPYK